MPQLDGINYRRANENDVFGIMNLYQIAAEGELWDSVLLDHRKLIQQIQSDNVRWLVADREAKIIGAFCLLLDSENRLGKLNRIILDPQWKESRTLLKNALPLLIDYLKDSVDIVYTTTRTLSMEQQDLSLKLGFKLLGIFPNVIGADQSRVNGVSAHFFEGVLTSMRQDFFQLHRAVMPFYEMVRNQCGLGELSPWDLDGSPESSFEPLPPLELIVAPLFVSYRYSRLNERNALSSHFYPFQTPNMLVVAPKQRVEIFVRHMPELRFAAIIGERIDLRVSPVDLYKQVALLLNERGVNYIEMLVDAADGLGIDYMIQAGFLPCAYLPSFKRQGDVRRDFVVLSRSFERFLGAGSYQLRMDPLYLGFLTEYCRLEEKQFLSCFL